MNEQKITFKYLIACMGAVLLTWLIHEFTHWITAESLGYDSILRLNSVSPATGHQWRGLHNVYVSATGPLITIIQAVLAFVLFVNKGWIKTLYPFLFTPLYMRLLAGGMNFIKPNDEGRISEYFGLGVFTLSIVVCLFLLFLVYKISKSYQLSWKFNGWTIIIIMFASSLLILGDQILNIRIL